MSVNSCFIYLDVSIVDTFMFTHNLTVIFTYAKDVYSLLFKFFIVEVGSNVTG